jgi:hypothetical protein
MSATADFSAFWVGSQSLHSTNVAIGAAATRFAVALQSIYVAIAVSRRPFPASTASVWRTINRVARANSVLRISAHRGRHFRLIVDAVSA